MSGGILGYTEILNRLNRNQIFQKGSWDESCMRAAGYDLRMAADMMFVPDPPEYKTGRFYPTGRSRATEVILQPGDVAFVSSVEKLCVPWDVVGTLGPKFSLAAKGVLVLTGNQLDPGYGLQEANDGRWENKEDERLHFLMANVGSDPVVLTPGREKIATVQLANVAEPPTKIEVQNLGFKQIEDKYLDSNRQSKAGLVFFRNMADLANEVSELKVELESFRFRLSGLEVASSQVVMFGLYLLCITFLGVSLTFMLSFIQNPNISINIANLSQIFNQSWRGLVLISFLFIGVSISIWLMIRGIVILVKKLFHNVARQRND